MGNSSSFNKFNDHTCLNKNFVKKLESLVMQDDWETKNKEAVTKLIEENFTLNAFTKIINFKLDGRDATFNNCIFNLLLFSSLHELALKYVESPIFDVNSLQKYHDKKNNSILMYAIEHKRKDIVDKLIDKWSDMSEIGELGDTVLMLACLHSYEDIALKILKRDDCKPLHLNKYNKSALTYAIDNKMKLFVRTYLKQFMSQNIFTTKVDKDYVIYSLPDEYNDLIEECFKSGYAQTVSASYITGEPILMFCIRKNLPTVYTYTPQHRNNNNETILIVACKYNNKKMINEIFDQHKIEDLLIDTITKDDNTALTYALRHNMDDVIDKLITAFKQQHQIKLDSYQTYINLALDTVSRMNHKEYAIKLLDNFCYDQNFILKVYKRSKKEVREVIIQYFDLADTSFLIEKYGVDKIKTLST